MSWYQRMMRQAIALERVTGLSISGDRTYGAPEQMAARVEEASAVIRDLDGEEVLITHRVALIAQVGTGDRVTLPDGVVRYVRSTRRGQTAQGGAAYTICEVG